MRERNNEASKRCRLKRRLKAESLEGQLNLLSMTNKMLKQRIAKMETISGAIKDGINQIQTSSCNCLQTVAAVQQVNRDCKDAADMSNADLLKTSKSYRDQNPELLLPPSSSDDDFSADLSSTNSPAPPPPTCGPTAHPATSFSGFLVKMNSAPVLTKIPASMSMSVPGTPTNIPSNPVYPRAKTALDIINDTIIKSLGSSPSTSYPSSPSPVPLNLVKIFPSQPASQMFARHASHGPMSGNSPQLIVAPTTSLNVDIVKREPESTTTTTISSNGVDPVDSCVAAATDGRCRGPLHNVNKLTSYLNAVTGYPVSTDDGSSAMERAIIKSRLRIPFWKADEVTLIYLLSFCPWY